MFVRQHAVMPRDGNEATLHVGIRCGARKFQIFDRVIPISPCPRPTSQFFEMKPRNEIVEMLMATVSESRLYDHFDVRIVVEGFANQLVLNQRRTL
jgi:hypothetical protein